MTFESSMVARLRPGQELYPAPNYGKALVRFCKGRKQPTYRHKVLLDSFYLGSNPSAWVELLCIGSEEFRGVVDNPGVDAQFCLRVVSITALQTKIIRPNVLLPESSDPRF